MSVRTRFAPSPTGHLHVGNARTAILSWLFARQQSGTFILRIEDTDIERSTDTAEQSIFADLEWLGLSWDEGPTNGGPFGPYRQSQRLKVYQEYLDVLQRKGLAYPCYCSNAEIEEKRAAALSAGKTPRYDRTCLGLTTEARRAKEREGRSPAWRFQVREGEISWQDLLKGDLIFSGETFGDFVLVRADGRPTYNFAAAIDDALMKISHVIRGDDHVSNTPKQILMYEAFGWTPPMFCHIPMILGPDRTRLSKRHGAASIEDFRKLGYLPEALFNFLSLLSWSSESGEDILSIEKITSEFDFDRMSKSPAVFDVVKLNWMNGQYIRSLDFQKLRQLLMPFLENDGVDLQDQEKLGKVISVVQNNLETLNQISELVLPFYESDMQLTEEQQEIVSRESSQKVYWAFSRSLQNFEDLHEESFRSIMKQVQNETGVMGKELWIPVRVALTGRLHGPELPQIAEILGKAKSETLIKKVIL